MHGKQNLGAGGFIRMQSLCKISVSNCCGESIFRHNGKSYKLPDTLGNREFGIFWCGQIVTHFRVIQRVYA
jgi:hypothetical protein